MKIITLLSALLLSISANGENAPEPKTFHGESYRSIVPATLSGATVIDDDAAFALWKTGKVAFIDVLPHSFKPKDLPKDTLWVEKKRLSIPGSIWLPNVGYEKLPDITKAYFDKGMNKATNGDKDTPIVLFCLDQCWMSWNTAKRAMEAGYTHVFWYPFGTDGWGKAEHPLEPLLPWVQD